MIRTAILLALCLPGFARAESFQLSFPVDCTLGENCFIQNYVDADPSPSHRDFGCGHLSYDGHSGTDIALYTEAELQSDMAVRPVAPGTVRATRDEMLDIRADATNAPDITGRSCGNAVIVAHDGGWESRYCHLKRGSVAVQTSDIVDTSTVIGAIGLSGRTEFPHLHLTITRDGDTIDPFQPDADAACGASENALWRDPIRYVPTGLLSAGAAPGLPEYDAIKAGKAHFETLPRTADALVFWVHIFGPHAGDQLRFDITGPDGPFLTQHAEIERDQARAFRAVGRRLRSAAWPIGDYVATMTLIHKGAPFETMSTKVHVR